MFDDDLVGQTTLPFSALAQDQLTKLQHLRPLPKKNRQHAKPSCTSLLFSLSARNEVPRVRRTAHHPPFPPPTSAARKIPNTGRHRAAAAHQTGPRFAVQCIQWQRRRIAKPGGTSLRRRCATPRRASPAPPSPLASGELLRPRLRACTSPRPSSAALAPPPPTDPTAPAPARLHLRGVAATASSSGRLSSSLLLVREVICSW